MIVTFNFRMNISVKIQCDVFETLTILFSHSFLLFEFLSYLLHFALPFGSLFYHKQACIVFAFSLYV